MPSLSSSDGFTVESYPAKCWGCEFHMQHSNCLPHCRSRTVGLLIAAWYKDMRGHSTMYLPAGLFLPATGIMPLLIVRQGGSHLLGRERFTLSQWLQMCCAYIEEENFTDSVTAFIPWAATCRSGNQKELLWEDINQKGIWERQRKWGTLSINTQVFFEQMMLNISDNPLGTLKNFYVIRQ